MAIQSNFPAVKPSLMLDFANTKQLDSRITYTRASTASYYDGVTTSKAEENLLLNSSTIGGTGWSGGQITITTNNATAPDGTTTATLLLANGAASQHFTNATASTSTSQTCSVYAKAGTNNFLQMRYGTDATAYANFDISTGAVGTVGAAATASIVSVGSGWYRCVISTTSASANGIYLLVVSGTTAASFESNSLSTSIYVWGAQLENRSSATAYTATTTQAITNYIPKLQTAASGVARFDCNPTTDESLGLLIEEQRTNLILYSEQFDNVAWLKINSSTITTNTIVSPDGTLTGDKLVRDSAASSYRVQQATSVTSGTAYTFSCYAKASQLSWIAIGAQTNFPTNTHAFFNLSSGVLGTIGSGATSASITSVGNGWYRCSVTATANATGASAFQGWLAPSDNTFTFTSGNTFDGVFLWGAQFEAGAFATSYIPTVASQVTRSADAASMTGTNFSSWYGSGDGTLYSEFLPISTSYGGFSIYADSSNWIMLQGARPDLSNRPSLVVRVGGATTSNTNTASIASSLNKLSGYFGQTGLGITLNGATPVTSTSPSMPSGLNTLYLSQNTNGGVWSTATNNGTLKKLAFYPIKVTSTNLVALTS